MSHGGDMSVPSGSVSNISKRALIRSTFADDMFDANSMLRVAVIDLYGQCLMLSRRHSALNPVIPSPSLNAAFCMVLSIASADSSPKERPRRSSTFFILESFRNRGNCLVTSDIV